MLTVKETIVVEGRDDLINLRHCLKADIIVTHGYGINAETWKKLEDSDKRVGLIILTDPDVVGERIRKRLAARFPKAKHAFISRQEGTKGDDVGVENASCEAILRALESLRTAPAQEGHLSQSDLYVLGLSAGPSSALLRDRLGAALGIGYANGKQFLHRLNHFAISKEEIEQALEKIIGSKNES